MHGPTKKTKRSRVTLRERLTESEKLRASLLTQLRNLETAREHDRKVINDYIAENKNLRKEMRVYTDARSLAEQEHERMLQTEINNRSVMIDALKNENWQLKGALGYEIPSHITPGEFFCGACDAKTKALLELDKRFGDQCEKIRIVNYLFNGGGND